MSCLCGSRGSEGRLRGSTSRAERSCSILRRGNAGDIHQISIRGRVRRLIKPTNVATGQQSMYSLMPRKRGSRLGWGLDRSLRRLFKPTFCGWNVFLLCRYFIFTHSLRSVLRFILRIGVPAVSVPPRHPAALSVTGIFSRIVSSGQSVRTQECVCVSACVCVCDVEAMKYTADSIVPCGFTHTPQISICGSVVRRREDS